MYLPPGSDYVVYKPFRYGRLNLRHSGGSGGGGGEGHSLSFLMNMLEDLWSKAIEEYLEIERKDFKVMAFHSLLEL